MLTRLGARAEEAEKGNTEGWTDRLRNRPIVRPSVCPSSMERDSREEVGGRENNGDDDDGDDDDGVDDDKDDILTWIGGNLREAGSEMKTKNMQYLL